MTRRNNFLEILLIGFALCIFVSCTSAAAQDVLSIGSVTADRGVPAQIPIHLVDNTKTLLGQDRTGYDNLIQAYALQVQCSPEDSVSSISIDFPDPGYADSARIYRTTKSAGKKVSLISVFSHSAMTLDFSGEGHDIGIINLVVSPSAPAGSTIEVSFVPSKTLLSNQAGTISESTAKGGLALQSGTVTVSNAPVATTVSIQTIKKTAMEKKRKKGKMLISRIGDLQKKITVKLKVSGSAESKTDYGKIPARVVFKKGRDKKTLIVKPIDDDKKEGREKVIVTLKKSKKYKIQKPSKAVIIIKDNDR